MKKIIYLYCIFFCIIISCSNKKNKKELTLSVASSMTQSIEEIIKIYNTKNSDIEIKLNSGGSGALEQQIIAGAPVDIFLSASKQNMDNLAKKKLIEETSQKNIVKNKLVLIGNKKIQQKIQKIEDLKKLNGFIALGETTTVPAGIYAKQALQKLTLWHIIETQVIYQKDATNVLQIVEQGEADVGIVYYSDALQAKNSFIIEDFPIDTYDPIIYPIAIIKDSKYKIEAQKFIDFLQSNEAKEIFKKNGFLL